MSVSVLKLEDDSLLAFNLSLISQMELLSEGLWFVFNGIQYATFNGEWRVLKIHPSEPQCVIDMWNKFINM